MLTRLRIGVFILGIKVFIVILILVALVLPKLWYILMSVVLGRNWVHEDLTKRSTPKLVLISILSLFYLWVEGSIMILVPVILILYKWQGATGVYAMWECVIANFWYIVPLFSILAVGLGFHILCQFYEQ